MTEPSSVLVFKVLLAVSILGAFLIYFYLGLKPYIKTYIKLIRIIAGLLRAVLLGLLPIVGILSIPFIFVLWTYFLWKLFWAIF